MTESVSVDTSTRLALRSSIASDARSSRCSATVLTRGALVDTTASAERSRLAPLPLPSFSRAWPQPTKRPTVSAGSALTRTPLTCVAAGKRRRRPSSDSYTLLPPPTVCV